MLEDESKMTDWESLLEGIAESVLAASDEELLEEVRDAGESPATVAAGVRDLLLRGVRNYHLSVRQRLESELRTEDLMQPSKLSRLPKTSAQRRFLLKKVIASKPALATLRHRELAQYSDEDIERDLAKLEALGLLDELLDDRS